MPSRIVKKITVQATRASKSDDPKEHGPKKSAKNNPLAASGPAPKKINGPSPKSKNTPKSSSYLSTSTLRADTPPRVDNNDPASGDTSSFSKTNIVPQATVEDTSKASSAGTSLDTPTFRMDEGSSRGDSFIKSQTSDSDSTKNVKSQPDTTALIPPETPSVRSVANDTSSIFFPKVDVVPLELNEDSSVKSVTVDNATSNLQPAGDTIPLIQNTDLSGTPVKSDLREVKTDTPSPALDVLPLVQNDDSSKIPPVSDPIVTVPKESGQGVSELSVNNYSQDRFYKGDTTPLNLSSDDASGSYDEEKFDPTENSTYLNETSDNGVPTIKVEIHRETVLDPSEMTLDELLEYIRWRFAQLGILFSTTMDPYELYEYIQVLTTRNPIVANDDKLRAVIDRLAGNLPGMETPTSGDLTIARGKKKLILAAKPLPEVSALNPSSQNRSTFSAPMGSAGHTMFPYAGLTNEQLVSSITNEHQDYPLITDSPISFMYAELGNRLRISTGVAETTESGRLASVDRTIINAKSQGHTASWRELEHAWLYPNSESNSSP